MLYLKSFTFPTDGEEFDVIINVKEKSYSSFYLFKILSQRGIEKDWFWAGNYFLRQQWQRQNNGVKRNCRKIKTGAQCRI